METDNNFIEEEKKEREMDLKYELKNDELEEYACQNKKVLPLSE